MTPQPDLVRLERYLIPALETFMPDAKIEVIQDSPDEIEVEVVGTGFSLFLSGDGLEWDITKEVSIRGGYWDPPDVDITNLESVPINDPVKVAETLATYIFKDLLQSKLANEAESEQYEKDIQDREA